MAQKTWIKPAYSGGRAVPVDHAPTFGDFLVALKNLFGDSYLAGVSPSDIRVYKSQGRLDTKEEITSDDALQRHGRTKNDPLLFLGPKRDVFYQMKLGGFPSESTFRVESTGQAFTVEDFLAAVYTQHRGLLSQYSVANFVAYKNDDAFSRTPKGEPLDRDTDIGTLGLSREDPVIVEVVELQIGSGVLAAEDDDDMELEPEYRRYTHSELGADFDKGLSVMKELNVLIRREDKAQILAGVEVQRAGIQPFQWGSVAELTEEQQRDAYRSYLETHLADVLSEKNLSVFVVNRQSTFLSAVIPGTDVELGARI